ncbi:MAG: DHH family phosphoesterase [Bacilli bacterium]|nr:DHH family phosphoesterase [Bacilli bacterium]
MKIRRQKFYEKFIDILNDYEKIVLVPHNEIDLDALGASVGLYVFLEKLSKEVYINIDEVNTELGVKRALHKIKKLNLNIDIKKLCNIEVDNNTLIIVLDHHKKEMSQNPDIYKMSKNIIVIDHHIEGRDMIGNTLEKHIDEEASSTTEIIFDIISNQDIEIPNYISTVMLAGLTLDTNNFSIKTTEKTHEVAAGLTRSGAVSKEVQYLLKEDLSKYIEMQKIIFNTEIIDGVYAITVGKKNEIYSKDQLAKIADSLLQFDDIEASFCIGKINSNIIGISARSLGNVNVQKIMEKLNGGGHLTDAACQMFNTSLTEAKKSLLKIIDKL